MVGKQSCSWVATVLWVGLQELGRHHKKLFICLNPYLIPINAPKGFSSKLSKCEEKLVLCLFLHWEKSSMIKSSGNVQGMGGDVVKSLGLRAALPCGLRDSGLSSFAASCASPMPLKETAREKRCLPKVAVS